LSDHGRELVSFIGDDGQDGAKLDRNLGAGSEVSLGRGRRELGGRSTRRVETLSVPPRYPRSWRDQGPIRSCEVFLR
jgi:hypothetical protein